MPIPKLDLETILLAFAVVTGLAVLLQTIILLAIYIAVRKAAGSIHAEVEKLRSSLMPVIYDTRDILANAQEFLAGAQEFFSRVAPKVEAAAADVVDITQSLRAQSVHIQASALEILERVRRQSDRLDGMISNTLNDVDRAGAFVSDFVAKPVRQISGILGVVKAVVESLRGPVAPRRS